MFASDRAKIMVRDIDPEPAARTVKDTVDSGGETASPVGNAIRPEFAEGIVKSAINQSGGLHVIVDHTGFTRDALNHKMAEGQWEKIIDLHHKAPFRIIRAQKTNFCDAARQEIQEGHNSARKRINISVVAGIGGNVG